MDAALVGGGGLAGPGPGSGPDGELPELASVHWRPRADARRLRRSDRLWTLSTVAHTAPFLATAIGLPLLDPVTIPVALIALAYAWFIPELYAARGAGVVREPRGRRVGAARSATAGAGREAADSRALGLLGDLVGHAARELLARTGMVLERGELGVWLVAGAGALLVRPGGRRVQCYCVHATGDELPRADRVAHLLLALRADESGFATVANLTFSGSCWRLRRRLPPPVREALRAAVAAAARGQ
ncbi:MAG: hypothetical protein JOZ07_15755 [Solirubrobacterales bacterium]|nr:hypothetical protein [Solirubrobacterales bacterium]